LLKLGNLNSAALKSSTAGDTDGNGETTGPTKGLGGQSTPVADPVAAVGGEQAVVQQMLS